MQLRTRWLPIFFFALAGCGNETEIPKEPTLFTDRDEMAFNREFGSGTYVGQTGYNSLVFENRGEGTLQVTDITMSAPSQFKLVLPEGFTPGTPLSLETYKRAFVTVEFRPTDNVAYTGTLTIKSNAANSPEKVITLNGLGVDP
ncbi:hypothetical protein JY651_32065 [Pyxidicoccus parkwayensis]|uniref:Lipoprotein n=1 Tax=Pyxidicoccus parkwayensis TaxID=2813578 RepID=A0ABX7NQQ6_9BACT|nr:hypothetical protein [Pyxidicoccus parkwaysis]QSQ19900.1 hypothetical protein JY651_32065 [Pyxidicoccus parkwaysis]